ncbi:transcription initiation factor TFIID subunit 13 [Acrasis kona]|uniref:Transcription initiation factor TFIID subunit 13 n=1 Tax=Acrasis kona TaxID=1008807 RepID=A0AAW2YU64_9EUKA
MNGNGRGRPPNPPQNFAIGRGQNPNNNQFVNAQNRPPNNNVPFVMNGNPLMQLNMPQTNMMQPNMMIQRMPSMSPMGMGMPTWGSQPQQTTPNVFPNHYIQPGINTLGNNNPQLQAMMQQQMQQQMQQMHQQQQQQQQPQPPRGRGRQPRQRPASTQPLKAPSPAPTVDVDDERSRQSNEDEEEDASSDGDETQNDESKKEVNSDDSDAEIDEEDEDGNAKRRKRRREKNKPRKRLFTRELRLMMYGFGDSENPLSETVDLMDDLVTEYITDMTCKAMRVANKRGKLQTEDLVFLIRKDRKKFARVEELLRMNEEIKRARRMLSDDLLNPGSKKF